MNAPHPSEVTAPHLVCRDARWMGGATTYEIRLEGAPDLAVLSAYEGVHVTVDGGGITVCARLPDQAALHGVLEQARRLGLDLVSVRVLQPRGHRAG